MFEFLRRNRKVTVYAPVDGQTVLLDEVTDKMFSQKVLGEGVAIKYEKGIIKSPINGKVVMLAATSHAIGLRTKEGAELLLHLGINTVELKGNGFMPLVKEKDQVKVGSDLMKIDFDYMQQERIDLITPIILTNKDKFTVSDIKTGSVKAAETPIFTINKIRS